MLKSRILNLQICK